MYQSKSTGVILTLCLVALITRTTVVEGQGILDSILNTRSSSNGDADVISNNGRDLAGERQQQPQMVSRVRDMFKDMMSVNVPVFFDMVRNGTSMGINVVSGLVKVERGEEAEKSGLVGNGVRRPLSVRVFGIPVYERGTRVRPLDSGAPGEVPSIERPSSSRPDEEDLPIQPIG